jgi:hypothetical protein
MLGDTCRGCGGQRMVTAVIPVAYCPHTETVASSYVLVNG